jgi:hypothetical protein
MNSCTSLLQARTLTYANLLFTLEVACHFGGRAATGTSPAHSCAKQPNYATDATVGWGNGGKTAEALVQQSIDDVLPIKYTTQNQYKKLLSP